MQPRAIPAIQLSDPAQQRDSSPVSDATKTQSCNLAPTAQLSNSAAQPNSTIQRLSGPIQQLDSFPQFSDSLTLLNPEARLNSMAQLRSCDLLDVGYV